MITQSLKEFDKEMFLILQNEQKRQRDSICLIPSENFTSKSVMETLGSVFQNKLFDLNFIFFYKAYRKIFF